MEERKLSLFAVDMTIYVENPKEVTKEFLKLISSYCNIAHKVKILKSIAFLYIRNEHMELKMRNNSISTVSKKLLRYKYNKCKTYMRKTSKL